MKLTASEVIGFTTSHTQKVTAQMVQTFAEVTGDHNPIHLDDEFAKTTRFGQRIAHGMLLAGLISRTLAHQLPSQGGIYLGQSLKFVTPVFIDDTVTVELKVLNYRESNGLTIVETVVKKQTGEICIKGEATVMFSVGKT